jgi:hypothetical protein
MGKRARWLLYAWLALWAAASAFWTWFSYATYWRWRCCFEDGRYFDGVAVHHDQMSVTTIPALLSLVMFIGGLIVLFRGSKGAKP